MMRGQVNLHEDAEAGHFLQAPKGLLKENIRGVSSSILMPCSDKRNSGKGDILPIDDVDDRQSARKAGGRLDGIGQTGADVLMDDQTVDHDLNGMLLFFSVLVSERS